MSLLRQRLLTLGIFSVLPLLVSHSAEGVTLAWDPNPEPDIAGYMLYYGIASGVYTNSTDVGPAVTFPVSGLADRVTYFFVVTAYDLAGLESDASNEVSFTVPGTNSPPSISAIADQAIKLGASPLPIAFRVSDVETPAGSLVVTGNSSNPLLVPDSYILFGGSGGNRTVLLLPGVNLFGTATITLKVVDANGAGATTSFALTGNTDGGPPTLEELDSVTIPEYAGSQAINLTGISSGSGSQLNAVSLMAFSSNPGLIPAPTVLYTNPQTTGVLSLAPGPGVYGVAIITVMASAGHPVPLTLVRSFTVTRRPVNSPRMLNRLNNLTTNENAGPQRVLLTGISSGAPNESDRLTVRAFSSNPGLIPNPIVEYVSPQSSGMLSFAPLAGAYGLATITVRVTDGQAVQNSVQRSFRVFVNPVRLQIYGSENGVTLSWPAWAAGFQLEEGSLSAIGWSPVAGSATVIGEQNSVTVEISNSGRLFRLRKP